MQADTTIIGMAPTVCALPQRTPCTIQYGMYNTTNTHMTTLYHVQGQGPAKHKYLELVGPHNLKEKPSQGKNLHQKEKIPGAGEKTHMHTLCPSSCITITASLELISQP